MLLTSTTPAFACFAILFAGTAHACPFCSSPSLTLVEQVEQSDVALLAKWTGGAKPKGEDLGSTDYEVVEVFKAPAKTFEEKDPVLVARYRPGRVGDLFLLTGTRARILEWDPPLPVTETVYRYIANAPKPDVPTAKRLEYFIDFLEFPEETIASDAYGEFANAPYEDIRKLDKLLPASRIREWVASDDTTPTRLGLYGLLLGLCGGDEDVALMQLMILEPTTEFRLGIEGVMSGYLVLTGEKGLKLLEDSKFKAKHLLDADGKPVLDADGNPEPVPFSETYAAMQALRFMWQYGGGRIEADRLKRSMRLLIARPELADLVIADLARWKDWSIIDRLVKLYGTEGYEIGVLKRAVIRYLHAARRDVPQDGKPGPHVAKAEKALALLRKRDPKTVMETEEFLRLLEGS